MCAFCGFGNSVRGILSNPVAFSPTVSEDDEDWSAVAPTPESATHVSMKFGIFKSGIAS